MPLTTQPAAVTAEGLRLDERTLLASAWGTQEAAFGQRFAGLPKHRRLPHLPGPPYHFMSRVLELSGGLTEAAIGSEVRVAYDLPDDPWYFNVDRHGAMPYCVLLEVALQPCGWLACYSGLPLSSSEDLFFRNLDGKAEQLRPVTKATTSIVTTATLTSLSRAGGMLLLGFRVGLHRRRGPSAAYRDQVRLLSSGCARSAGRHPSQCPKAPAANDP